MERKEAAKGARTQSCDTLSVNLGERTWMEGEVDGREGGERERRQDGVIYSCCEIADRIYRRQRKWAIGRREKEALDGRDVASSAFLFFPHAPADGLVLCQPPSSRKRPANKQI